MRGGIPGGDLTALLEGDTIQQKAGLFSCKNVKDPDYEDRTNEKRDEKYCCWVGS